MLPLAPTPCFAFEVGVASEFIAETSLFMLWLEVGFSDSSVQPGHQRLHCGPCTDDESDIGPLPKH